MFRLIFTKKALKDLKKLDKNIARRIIDYLEKRIEHTDNPKLWGSSLEGEKFQGLWKYRVGTYRILCQIKEEELVVIVVTLGHRREIYKK